MTEALEVWEGRSTAEWEGEHGLSLFEAHDVIGSTNDRVRTLADGGALPMVVVVSNEQTAGRGRGGKRWISPKGGLWFSVLIRNQESAVSHLTPLLVGLAVSRAVRRVTGVGTSLKWPNDVLVGDNKLAGILCEGVSGDAVIAGVGLNLSAPSPGWPKKEVGTPTALLDHIEVPPRNLRGSVLSGCLTELAALIQFDSPERILAGWSELDALQGREVICSMGAEGTARGIGPDGKLRVDTSEGTVSVGAGSVRIRTSTDTSQAD